MNKKGFMMAEVVVVSAVVMIAITGLYASYNKIYSIYNTRVNYYDVDTLYRLAYYRDFLIENTDSGEKLLNKYIGDAKNDGIKPIDKLENLIKFINAENNAEKVFLIYDPKNNLKSDNFNGINSTFIDYINFLSTSIEFDDGNYYDYYLMIMESCNNDNKDNCRYAYLEVYSEK